MPAGQYGLSKAQGTARGRRVGRSEQGDGEFHAKSTWQDA